MTRTQRRILWLLVVLAAMLALFIVLLLALDIGRGPKRSPIRINLLPVTASPTQAARASATRPATQAPQGVTARTRPSTAVRTAPDPGSTLLAELASGQVLPVLGRTPDGNWLLVQFTTTDAPSVQRAGWVQSASVDVGGDVQAVAIVAPNPAPTPPPTPTLSPSPSPAPSPTRTPTAAPSATRTAASGGALPDLALQDFGLITVGAGTGFLRVDVANFGQRDLVQQQVEITGFDQTGAQVLHLTTGPITIASGSFQSITTGYKPTQRTMLTVVVNPNKTIAEADAPAGFDDPNNALTKTITPP